MGFGFRKSFKVGPFRSTISHRGITNSVGAGGLRYSKRASFTGSGSKRQRTTNGEPTATSNGNPLVGLVIIAVVGFVLYKILT